MDDEASCLAESLSRGDRSFSQRSSRVIIEAVHGGKGAEPRRDSLSRVEITVCGARRPDRYSSRPASWKWVTRCPTDLDGNTVREGWKRFSRAGIRAIGIDNGAAKGRHQVDSPRSP